MSPRRIVASLILAAFIPVTLAIASFAHTGTAEAQTACFTTNFNSVTITRQRPFITGVFTGNQFRAGDGTYFKNNNGGPLLAAANLAAGDTVTTSTTGTMYVFSDNSFPFGPNGAGNANLLFELVGQWTNDADQVIGNGFDIDNPSTLTVPAGATRLYVSFTDTDYFDNHGSYTFQASARRCTGTSSSSSSLSSIPPFFGSSSSSSAGGGFSTIDVKINGQDGTVNAPIGSTVNISWTSSGVQRCDTDGSQAPWGPNRSVPVSGNENVVVTKSMTFSIQCAQTATSPMIVMDVVGVNATGSASSSSSSFSTSFPSSSSISSISSSSSSSFPSSISSSSSFSSSSASSQVSSMAPGLGCIQIYKQAYDMNGNEYPVTPQFTFVLDGSQTTFNGANGRARFDNVTPGTHTVTETVPNGWRQLLVTPENGVVSVQAGRCTGIVFINRQMFVAGSSSSSSTSSLSSSISSSSISSSSSSSNSSSSLSSISSSASSSSSSSSSMSSSVSSPSSSSSSSLSSSSLSSSVSSISSASSSLSSSSSSISSSSSSSSVSSSVSSSSSTSSVNLTIAKTDNRTSVNRGDRITYTISISNSTGTNATNATVIDDLPPQVTFVSASNGGTYNSSNNRVTWTGLTIPANSTLFITVTVDVKSDATSTLTNIATVNGGNSATDSTTVNAPPQTFLQLTKFASYQQVNSSRTIDYTVTVRNAGSNNALNVVVIDTTDSDTTITNTGGGTQNGNQLQWNVGTLTPNETRTFQYRVSVNSGVPSGTVISNTVRASGSNAAEVQVTLNLTLVGAGNNVQFAQSQQSPSVLMANAQKASESTFKAFLIGFLNALSPFSVLQAIAATF